MKTKYKIGDIIFATYNVTNKLLIFVHINAKINVNKADELMKHRIFIYDQFDTKKFPDFSFKFESIN